jgi:hypothetical protein
MLNFIRIILNTWIKKSNLIVFTIKILSKLIKNQQII